METKDTMDLDTLNRSILGTISADIKECEDYQRAVILPTMKERYQIYYADKEYYKAMFPKLSRTSSVVSTDVTDTIEWALPSLMKVFTSGDDVVSITGHDALDSHKADAMQDLINFQLQRENHFFPILYNWMKDALITGMGLTKCYWDRKEAVKPVTCVLNWTSLQELRKTGVEITNISQPDQFGDYTVTYNSTYYLKNAPKIENILCTDVLYSPDAKSLDEANFVAHKKLVTLSYLREMEQQGIYANVDQIKGDHVHGKYGKDDIDTEMDAVIGDKYYNFPSFSPDEARDEVTIYECYVKIDINGDGILEDMIITVCQDTILRCEPNYMGRHPFFAIAPTQDPHRIWSKRSYAELIGEIQHLKVALTRQIIHNLALSNDPKVIMSPEAINIEDFNKGRSVIRKKPGYAMSDAVLPMPVTQIAPYTFNFLEYLEGQKEQRTGITRYNQGLDASSLNRMLDINTPVPMANGSRKLLKDIVDGDMLIGQNGKPTMVVKAHIIHDPERAYEIKFSNGEVLKAGGEHLWTVFGPHRKRKTIDTDTLFKLAHEYKQPLFIDRVYRPDNNGDIDLPIDPYILGVFLGDGCLHTNRFTSMDQEVVDAMSEWAKSRGGFIRPASYQNAGKAVTYDIVDTDLRAILKELHIVRDSRYDDMKENQKHIPEIFFSASYRQRMELLRGLMDTDGCHHSGSLVIFSQANGQLLDDVERLICSFGWNYSKTEHFPGKLTKEGRTYWHLNISCLDNPFRLSRKANKYIQSKRSVDRVKIVSIEPIDIIPMRCLTVDAEDGQFCVGKHYTVTHNTATGISAILNQSNQRLELIARMFAETGIYELYRFLISLNQKFIDQTTVVRLSGEPLEINPEDLDGKFDLVVNSGLSIQSKAAVGTQLQSLLTAIMQTNSAGVQVATPHNIYNIFKKWLETQGIKNVGDYISDPVIAQQRTMLEMQVIQTTLQTLPPDVVQYYFTYGSLPIQVLYSLPPYVQVVFLGHQLPQSGQAPQESMGAMPQAESPQFGGTGGAVTGVVRPIVKQGSDVLSPANQIGQQAPDNRLPAGMPTEPQQGIGGF